MFISSISKNQLIREMCVRDGYPAFAQTVELFENCTLTQKDLGN